MRSVPRVIESAGLYRRPSRPAPLQFATQTASRGAAHCKSHRCRWAYRPAALPTGCLVPGSVLASLIIGLDRSLYGAILAWSIGQCADRADETCGDGELKDQASWIPGQCWTWLPVSMVVVRHRADGARRTSNAGAECATVRVRGLYIDRRHTRHEKSVEHRPR